ncbi:MAG: family 10 glycosylhydrolase [Muribaculaceae bacterium]|nr:family 10 glycosylhydrolase [Muribaculaceae bacterium]
MNLKNIIKLNLAAIAAAGLFSFASCSDDYNGFELWDDYEPAVPVLKPRYIWVDAASNFPDFANSVENITRDLTLAKNAGFTDIVVDVRPTTGDILFKSSLCDQVKSLNAWVTENGVSSKKTIYRTATWDYLQAFIDEGHKLGLRVHAGFNTMTGGHVSGGAEQGPEGILFRDASKKEWANWRYNGGDPKNVMDLGDYEKFFNPGNPEVQEYLCGLLADLAKYNLDGIVLDRGRYNDLYSDFSPLSRQQFEEYIGVKLSKFPGDILPPKTTNTTLATPYGQYTTKWLEFRAKTIYDFMSKAREAVKNVNADLKFGVYVGGWYRSYYNTGVNWASNTFDPSKNNQWASPRYKNYGYAGLMDQILIGAYANPTAVNGTDEWTMQGFCNQAMLKIKGDCPLVVGGPDVDWRWNPKADWSQDPNNSELTNSTYPYTKTQILDGIRNSVSACANSCDGYFLFDIIHLKIDPEKWDAIKAGNDKYVADWNDKYGDKEEKPAE